MASYRHGNRNPQNIYRVNNDGTETFVAVAMSEMLAYELIEKLNIPTQADVDLAS